ncbi:Protein SRT-42 b, partial [Aphelenchoides avenae]
MEFYFFGGKEFERLYNCSSYDVGDVPVENRLHPVVGWTLLLLFAIFEAAYVPCIPAIGAHLNDSASYKFMYFISFCDVICLLVNGLATGSFSLLGTVYCSCPNLMYLIGALGT